MSSEQESAENKVGEGFVSESLSREIPKSNRESPVPPSSIPFFRSTRFQAAILAAVFFCGAGMYGALLSLGAGGLVSPRLYNITSGMLYALNFVFSFVTPALINVLGERYVLSLGVVSYSVYAASLYCNNKFGTVWFLYFGSTLQGICTAFLWVVQGAIVMAYPEPNFRGRFISIWLASISIGNMVGALITLGINAKSRLAGAISTVSYIPLITIAALGPFFALLLSLPHQVVRRDGLIVQTNKLPNALEELKRVFSALRRREIVLLLPCFIYAQWYISYQSTFTAVYHSVRGRALIGFLSSIFGISGTFAAGSFLDIQSIKKSTKFTRLYYIIYASYTAIWVALTVIQWYYQKTHPFGLDWSQGEYYIGFVFLLLWAFIDHAFQTYTYALVATLSQDIDELSRYTALMKAVNLGGAALAFGVQVEWSMMGAEAFLFGLWVVQVIPTWLVVRKVEDIEPVKS